MNYKIPYPVGTTKGRDHIYWPVGPRSDVQALVDARTPFFPGSMAFWPIGVSLETIMALSWRVKQMKIEGTVSGTDGFDSADFSITNCDVQYLRQAIDFAELIVDERGLISNYIDGKAYTVPDFGPNTGGDVPRRESVLANRGLTSYTPSITGTSNCSGFDGGVPSCQLQMFNILDDPAFATVIYDPVTKLFSPYISFFARAFNTSIGCEVTVSIDGTPGGSSTYGVPPVTFGNLVIDPVIAPSFTVPLQIAMQGGKTATLNDWTITATEFWPYKTSLGLPVYDTATGVQLNDPFS